jgi:hypothetical protein
LIQFIDHYLFDTVYTSSNMELVVSVVLALEY